MLQSVPHPGLGGHGGLVAPIGCAPSPLLFQQVRRVSLLLTWTHLFFLSLIGSHYNGTTGRSEKHPPAGGLTELWITDVACARSWVSESPGGLRSGACSSSEPAGTGFVFSTLNELLTTWVLPCVLNTSDIRQARTKRNCFAAPSSRYRCEKSCRNVASHLGISPDLIVPRSCLPSGAGESSWLRILPLVIIIV